MKKMKHEIEKIYNEPEYMILKDGKKIDLKECNFVLAWDIGQKNIVTANFDKENSAVTSNLLYRTSIACRLYDLGVQWKKALEFALNKSSKEAAELLIKLRKRETKELSKEIEKEILEEIKKENNV